MTCPLCGETHGFFDICPDQRMLNCAILIAVKEGKDVSHLLTVFR